MIDALDLNAAVRALRRHGERVAATPAEKKGLLSCPAQAAPSGHLYAKNVSRRFCPWLRVEAFDRTRLVALVRAPTVALEKGQRVQAKIIFGTHPPVVLNLIIRAFFLPVAQAT